MLLAVISELLNYRINSTTTIEYSMKRVIINSSFGYRINVKSIKLILITGFYGQTVVCG